MSLFQKLIEFFNKLPTPIDIIVFFSIFGLLAIISVGIQIVLTKLFPRKLKSIPTRINLMLWGSLLLYAGIHGSIYVLKVNPIGLFLTGIFVAGGLICWRAALFGKYHPKHGLTS
ncbi:MAG: hypothetical protein ACE5WD_06585 [Candidatus Aminicenantia bacterium]